LKTDRNKIENIQKNQNFISDNNSKEGTSEKKVVEPMNLKGKFTIFENDKIKEDDYKNFEDKGKGINITKMNMTNKIYDHEKEDNFSTQKRNIDEHPHDFRNNEKNLFVGINKNTNNNSENKVMSQGIDNFGEKKSDKKNIISKNLSSTNLNMKNDENVNRKENKEIIKFGNLQDNPESSEYKNIEKSAFQQIGKHEEKEGIAIKDKTASNTIINLNEKNIENTSDIAKNENNSEIKRNEIVNQIVDKCLITVKDGQSKINIRLKPDFLGPLKLNITAENNQISIKMISDNIITKDLLENSIYNLKSELQNHGLDVGKLDIILTDENIIQKTEKENDSFLEYGKNSFGREKEKDRENNNRKNDMEFESENENSEVDYFA
jgi:flagellar hook-length control protein FliK